MSTPHTLSALYQTVVQSELGFVARIDDDGDVVFRHPDMGIMYFSLSESDPEFLRLVYPSFMEANDLHVSRTQLLDIISAVNNGSKAVKLTLQDDQEGKPGRVSASVEGFVAAANTPPDEALLRGIIARCISVIRHGVTELVKASVELRKN
ncbi:hypothetical protein [Achromobacter sp.]|uniref:hypothetical protein n=1 Tax=Achromobacter sp. TaxID=134375 RepID=UPI0028AD1C95|nr:hypothetical protein [Achromobacter sp.]